MSILAFLQPTREKDEHFSYPITKKSFPRVSPSRVLISHSAISTIIISDMKWEQTSVVEAD